jgi:protein gp37
VHLGCSKGPSLGITWCIAGPETGPRARPCKREWVADLYEQCRAAGVPFFDKRDVLGKGIREWPEVSRV